MEDPASGEAGTVGQSCSAPTQPVVGTAAGAIHFWNSFSQWACDMPTRGSGKSSGNAAIAGTSSMSFHSPCISVVPCHDLGKMFSQVRRHHCRKARKRPHQTASSPKYRMGLYRLLSSVKHAYINPTDGARGVAVNVARCQNFQDAPFRLRRGLRLPMTAVHAPETEPP